VSGEGVTRLLQDRLNREEKNILQEKRYRAWIGEKVSRLLQDRLDTEENILQKKEVRSRIVEGLVN
jgi:hypothetical protein